jgi:hypothetical protein
VYIGIFTTCRNAEDKPKDKRVAIILFSRGPYTIASTAMAATVSTLAFSS